MLPGTLWLLCLAVLDVRAQNSDSTTTTSTSRSTTTGTRADDAFSFTNAFTTLTGTQIPTSAFTGSEYTYLIPTGQSTVATLTETITTNGTTATVTTTSTRNTQITVSSDDVSLTYIGGITTNTTTNQTATSTTSSVRPTNTVPCNGFPEFCSRQYSNITMVTAHNAAFVVPNNAASNQALDITSQLNDGIRMLQGQVHWENDTLWNCHTSCQELNAGTWEAELVTVRTWLEQNRNEVLTILIGNSDRRPPSDYVVPLTNAGLLQYVYTPSYVPQYRDQWPTLGEMIITGKRLVIFMDYDANQTAVPYILDEFSHMWETPFSPVDPSFPCTLQRPPGLNETLAKERYMYLANHNLNVAVDLSSLGISTDSEILIPNTADLNQTNGELNQLGQLGAMSLNCTADWGRPPNFLLVDYYNYGSPAPPGSVFRVAAAANGVTYTQSCCGTNNSAAPILRASSAGLAIALIVAVLMGW